MMESKGNILVRKDKNMNTSNNEINNELNE